MTCYL